MRAVTTALMILLAGCGGSSTSTTPSPTQSPDTVAMQRACVTLTDIRNTLSASKDHTITTAETIAALAKEGTAIDADFNLAEGPPNRPKLYALDQAVGHAKVAVDQGIDLVAPANELNTAMAAMPC